MKLVKNERHPLVGIALIEHLGDIVACEPVASYLKESERDVHIVWIVKPAYRELVMYNPKVDTVISVHCLTVKDMLVRSGIFSRCIDLHFKERHCTVCHPLPVMVTEEPLAGKITLDNFYRFGGILEAFSRYAELPVLHNAPRIWSNNSVVRTVDALCLPEMFITIHCTSNTSEKEWGTDHWTKLTHEILQEYPQIAVVEIGSSSVVNITDNDAYINLCGSLSVLESAEVIRRSMLFIGIDSGPAHMANAVGTFGLILMGSYLGFESYNPFSGGYGNGENAMILQHHGQVSGLPFETVKKKVDECMRKYAGMYIDGVRP